MKKRLFCRILIAIVFLWNVSFGNSTCYSMPQSEEAIHDSRIRYKSFRDCTDRTTKISMAFRLIEDDEPAIVVAAIEYLASERAEIDRFVFCLLDRLHSQALRPFAIHAMQILGTDIAIWYPEILSELAKLTEDATENESLEELLQPLADAFDAIGTPPLDSRSAVEIYLSHPSFPLRFLASRLICKYGVDGVLSTSKVQAALTRVENRLKHDSRYGVVPVYGTLRLELRQHLMTLASISIDDAFLSQHIEENFTHLTCSFVESIVNQSDASLRDTIILSMLASDRYRCREWALDYLTEKDCDNESIREQLRKGLATGGKTLRSNYLLPAARNRVADHGALNTLMQKGQALKSILPRDVLLTAAVTENSKEAMFPDSVQVIETSDVLAELTAHPNAARQILQYFLHVSDKPENSAVQLFADLPVELLDALSEVLADFPDSQELITIYMEAQCRKGVLPNWHWICFLEHCPAKLRKSTNLEGYFDNALAKRNRLFDSGLVLYAGLYLLSGDDGELRKRILANRHGRFPEEFINFMTRNCRQFTSETQQAFVENLDWDFRETVDAVTSPCLLLHQSRVASIESTLESRFKALQETKHPIAVQAKDLLLNSKDDRLRRMAYGECNIYSAKPELETYCEAARRQNLTQEFACLANQFPFLENKLTTTFTHYDLVCTEKSLRTTSSELFTRRLVATATKISRHAIPIASRLFEPLDEERISEQIEKRRGSANSETPMFSVITRMLYADPLDEIDPKEQPIEDNPIDYLTPMLETYLNGYCLHRPHADLISCIIHAESSKLQAELRSTSVADYLRAASVGRILVSGKTGMDDLYMAMKPWLNFDIIDMKRSAGERILQAYFEMTGEHWVLGIDTLMSDILTAFDP